MKINMFLETEREAIQGNHCSFVLNFVPLFNVKPEGNLTTQRVGKTCSPNSIKIIIPRNQGAQGKHSK